MTRTCDADKNTMLRADRPHSTNDVFSSRVAVFVKGIEASLRDTS